MKKNLLIFSLSIFACATSFAQDSTEVSKVDEYNKWSIELNAGQSKGIKPYTTGYFASDRDKVLGSITLNHYELGVRYMFSPTFGLKLDGAYDKLENLSDLSSDFELQQIRIGLQGVVNAARLFDIQEKLGRFGMLFHGGVQVAQMTPKMGPLEGKNEWNGGIMVGFTPEFRIMKNLALTADFTLISNVRQHFNWDGAAYSDDNNNLAGSMYTTSLGLSYSFGSHKIHGDFATIINKQQEEINALEKRVGQIENDMSDSDQDGVPDYLDAEPNSIAGVAVDTKGRMVDINQNGVPDELEKYLNNTYVTNENYNSGNDSVMMKKFINDGYVATYFDFNKKQPTNVSTEGIDFIRTYLLNNPDASVDIIGHADEIGNTPYNNKLANDRAANVKEILLKAGIASERLNVISQGEDNSVDKDSAGARKLVRRVTFRVK